MALYPFYALLPGAQFDPDQDAHEIVLGRRSGEDENPTTLSAQLRNWYLRMCLACAERSGAAVVKLMQWAGSRPDLFGPEFCNVFSKLQDDTTPHRWKHTARAMRRAYGPDWESKIKLGEILGSGCIGQVYSGVILENGVEKRKVAVKVLHPSVEDDMEADLDLMRLAAYTATRIQGGVTWLDWPELVEEFARLLRFQLDLRFEAHNIERFRENFKDWSDTVLFPELVPEFPPVDRHVLVESFLDGVPVLDYARAHRDDKKLLTDMCNRAIAAICKMIFLDNFVHGKC